MRPNALRGAVAGAAGGLVGSWMMVRFQHVIGQDNDDSSTSRGERDDSARQHRQHRQNALPNDTDGTFPDEPATMQAASVAMEAVTGHPLDHHGKEIGGPIVHYAFGAIVGALYGAAVERRPETAKGAGVPFGAAVWLVADEIGVPLAGFASKPTDYPASRHASALASHLVFGVTLEGVRRAIRGAPGA